MPLTPTLAPPTLDPSSPGVASLPLSREMATLKRSVMRELIKVIAQPGVISLAGGLPASELLPLAALRRSLDEVLARDGAGALQYSPPHAPLQRWISETMRERGVDCSPEQVFITGGNQQGLTILSRLFLDPGDPAVIEAITFTGIQQITAGRGAEVRTVPTDLANGVDVEALEEAFRRSPRPRLAVLIPDFHNPLGVSLSLEKRQAVADLASHYGVPVVEDDPYSPLRFEGETLPPIKAFDAGGFVFYLGSFSKILAPALRLGWLIAPPALLPKITVLRESIDLESSTLIQRAVAEFLARGYLDPHLSRFNAANRVRRAALLTALETHLGGLASWSRPQGGLFVWLRLPERIDAWEMLDAAVARKIAYIPGGAFAVTGGHHNTMRLNFSSVTPETIPAAVATLSELIKARL